ncbi:MFS transporter [Leucobacter chinensis]|uniref:MFS transporter n=1 Tax=Leucobacter chinensis TaxID=2851010 RepID=UPI001C234B15|nr:MFS transporter [Leucobacter chinensis]
MSASTEAPAGAVSEASVRRIAWAAFVGNALEWYDFFLYGTAAAAVFQQVFYAGDDLAHATTLSLLTFAAGFLTRPLGAIVFSHIGDRYGRRTALLITLILMGVCTGGIGLLPSYAAIGIAAPIMLLLFRIGQGLSASGEWTGATLLAIEYAPPHRRGFYASIVQLGSPAGTIASSGAFMLVMLLPHESFVSWGWRLPFLAAFVLVAIGIWIRLRIEETPEFQKLVVEAEVESYPALQIFREAPGRVLLGAGVYLFGMAGYFFMTTFMIAWVASKGQDPAPIIGSSIVGATIQLVVTPWYGRLADRFGSARVMMIGGFVTLAYAPLLFMLVDTGVPAFMLCALAIAPIFGVTMYAPAGALLSDLFPPRLQYSGLALSTNLTSVVAGFVPTIGFALWNASNGSYWPLVGFYMLLIALTILSVWISSRSRNLRTGAETAGIAVVGEDIG